MATERIRLSSRASVRKLVLLVPAFMIMAAVLNTQSCSNNGLLEHSNNNGSPTATPTSGTGTLGFVTNFNDGKVSSFTRNTTTGALKLTGQFSAGAKSGPRGVVATPAGAFLYVANISDNNIYEYSIDSTNGTLTPLSPASVSNGSGTGPDEMAINSSGTLLWVTDAHSGQVSIYTINTTTNPGQLTANGTIGGFNTPFGITLHPSLAVLYVSDTVTGLVWPMTYNTTTGALTQNFTPEHSPDTSANTPAAIAIDSGGDSLFIADQGNGEVSSFAIDDTGALTPVSTFANSSTSNVPVGVGITVNNAIEYLFTANQGDNSVSSFSASGTTVNIPPTLVTGYNGATGLVVDPQGLFVYTADKSDGTVGQSTINGSCGQQLCGGPLVSTESPKNKNSGPFGITLAQ